MSLGPPRAIGEVVTTATAAGMTRGGGGMDRRRASTAAAARGGIWLEVDVDVAVDGVDDRGKGDDDGGFRFTGGDDDATTTPRIRRVLWHGQDVDMTRDSSDGAAAMVHVVVYPAGAYTRPLFSST